MKRAFFPLAAFVLATGPVLNAAPLLHYDFNTPGSSQTSTGSLGLTLVTREGTTATDKTVSTPAGPDGSSVLNFSGAPQNTTLEASVAGVDALTTDLGSFTITAWVYNNVSAANSRIFYLRGGSSTAIDFNLSGSAGNASQLILSVNGAPGVGSNFGGTGSQITIPNNNSEWTMVGVTYDATDGTVTFYSGTLGGTLVSYTSNTKLTNAQVTNSTHLNLANINGGRILNAYVDEIGFYNQALNAGEMGEIFQAIPEPGTALSLVGGTAVLAFAAHRRRRASSLRKLGLTLAVAGVTMGSAHASSGDLFQNGDLRELKEGHPAGWPVGGVTDAENYEIHVHQNGPAEAPVSVQLISHAAETSRYMAQIVEVEPGASYLWRARLLQNGGRGLMWAAAVADTEGKVVSWEARTYLSSYVGHPLYPHFVSSDKMRGSSEEGWREETLSFTVPSNVAKIRFSIGAYFSTGDLRVGPMSLTKTADASSL